MPANGIKSLAVVSVTSSPTLIVTEDQGNTQDLQGVVIYPETVAVIIGGATVSATTGATRCFPGVPTVLKRRAGALYAISTGATTNVRIDLLTGVR